MRVFNGPARRMARTYVTDSAAYSAMMSQSLRRKEAFWLDYARERVSWIREPQVALDASRAPFYKWFPDGEVNMCYNAVDRQVLHGRGVQTAIAYESHVGGRSREITYKELLQQVEACAAGLRSLGVEKGDRVVIYMPMVPEAIVAMLACNRLGAIHSVVFGGFAPRELAARIRDAQPKAIITSTCGIEKARVLPYLPMVYDAIDMLEEEPDVRRKLNHLIVHDRTEFADAEGYAEGQSRSAKGVERHDYERLVANAMERKESCDCVALNANDPLYILYTSGTTGRPKGVLRDNTHVVGLQWSMDHFMGMTPGETYWCASDIGWTVGHSYTVFGPLLQGCTTLLYEGKPVGTPDASSYWKLIEKHEVTALFTAPTAVRAIRQVSWGRGELSRST
uniref:AMP-dependent synthetase/ligase domain-containing protein n=1 Tax=Pinguiococcus pyrenoidosus TaxID=172671 RepID=A0A7R9U837_9STRA|mmetsp:Transcript_18611/g.70398  ORF Transcript_18611/g.70398 Transcript_18611/m.70398 type:complete len:394 (+) Transcript_18611:117-1298(+)